MRLLRYSAFCILNSALLLSAATKVFLHDAGSPISLGPGYLVKRANSTQGSAVQTAVINSAAGYITGQYWPSTNTAHILTKTAAGTPVVWISDPLAAGVTISGTITPNLWGLESATACNCGAMYQVLRWDAKAGGIVKSLGASAHQGLTEWGTSAAVRTAPTLAPSSTAFNARDRIVILIYNDDGATVTEGSGRTWTLDYDAAIGVNGDSYLSFTETITFSADSNNAPSRGFTSRLDGRADHAHALD